MTPRTVPVAVTWALRLGAAAFGAVWLVAAVSKAIAPLDAYELLARVVGGGIPAKAGLVLVAAAEAALGTAMLVGAVRSLAPTVLGLVATTALLVVVRAGGGGAVACGCFLTASDVESAIVRNEILLAAAAPLLVASIAVRRRTAAQPAPGASPSDGRASSSR